MGNDDDTGLSTDHAFKTMVRAAQFLAPNVTVYVGPGHYQGLVDVTGIASTADAPVSLIADSDGSHTGDAPGEVIADADGDLAAIRVSKSPYVLIDGFIVTGAADKQIGLQIRSTSPNATVRNCVVTNTSKVDGIVVQDSDNFLIFNNLLFDNQGGIRIAGSSNGRIINNSVVENKGTGISVAEHNAVASTGVTLQNNIIQDSGNNVSLVVSDGPPSSRMGFSSDYDLAFAPALGDQTKTYRPASLQGAHDINEDAVFVDTVNGDFRLTNQSPAIDTGKDLDDADLMAILQARTTTTDDRPDHSPVDIGYHYPIPK